MSFEHISATSAATLLALLSMPLACGASADEGPPDFALPQGCRSAELLYSMTDKDWVMEGGGVAEWDEGKLRLSSKHFTESRSNIETDHFVYWLKRDFPADFAVEWDFRFPDLKSSPNGLAILFFCTKGAKGQDLFDPSLAKRDGIFERYYDGDISCYHISYFAGKRGQTNVRKNPGLHLVAFGKDLVAQGGSERWHHLVLAHYGTKIELSVDGQVCISWSDDGKTGGPSLSGGKIGLRQQNDLRWGEYRNLRVYGLR